MHRREAGFTLIELMIVVVVVGVLASLAIPRFHEVAVGAKEAEAGPLLKQLYTLQERYVQKNSHYATAIDSLEGGRASFASTRYYEVELTPDTEGTRFVACAKPKSEFAAELAYFSVDRDRGVTRSETGCE